MKNNKNLAGKILKLCAISALLIGVLAVFFVKKGPEREVADNKKILMSIVPKNEAYLIPKYLSHIDQLDYDKKSITVYVNTAKNDHAVKELLANWVKDKGDDYRQVIVENEDDGTNTPIEIRNKSLKKVKESDSDYYFSVESDCLITPCTLKELIKTDKPIVSPLLHTIPGENQVYSNYFYAISKAGYYINHPNYLSILHRTMKGTFKVPVVFKVYLIQSDAVDKLGQIDKTNEYDFIVFARHARQKNVDQYICNEKEFGLIVRMGEENAAEKFATIAPYINAHQQQEKKIIYIKPNYWGDIFNPNSLTYSMTSWIALRSALQAAGYELTPTDSLNNLHNFEKLIVFEVFPEQIIQCSRYPKEKLVLMLWEPPNVLPQNYNSNNYKNFSRVCTWRDDLVDNNKYQKLFYPDQRPMKPNLVDFETKKLTTLVASNKGWNHPNQLCKERIKTIEFYERAHPEDLDLFGINWPVAYKTYKGKMGGDSDSKAFKINALQSYKFSYAYENVKEEPGYVTEKIFNCFEAGCVPIYLGASNITQYVPKNCFIDRRDFENDESLYEYLKNMKKEEHDEYITHVKDYFNSDQVKPFTIDHFIKSFMGIINPDYEQIIEKPVIAKTNYDFPNDPIDVVMIASPKDQATLDLCIQGIKDNCSRIGRIIVISSTPLTDKAEWYDVGRFLFDKQAFAMELSSYDESIAKSLSVDRYYEQMLKLYAPLVIPDISSNVLMLAPNTIFVNPVEFTGPNGAGFYATEKDVHEHSFVQCRRLIPGFKPAFDGQANVEDFILYQKPVLQDLFNTIKENQSIDPWKAICRTNDFSDEASEYELYFNFAFAKTDQVALRDVKGISSPKVDDLQKFKEAGYSYVTIQQ